MKVRATIVTCYSQLGELDLALDTQQDMYSEAKRIFGETSEEALSRAQNLVLDLMNKGRYSDARTIGREAYRTARRVHGPDHGLTLALAHGYAYSLVHPGGAAPRSDVVESLVVLSDAVKRLTRKLGANHPETRRAAHDLGTNRFILKTMDSTVEK